MDRIPKHGEVTVEQLIRQGVDQLEEARCSESYILCNKTVWIKFSKFSGDTSRPYSDRLRWDFLESHGIARKHEYGRIDERKERIRAAMRILANIHAPFSSPTPVEKRPSFVQKHPRPGKKRPPASWSHAACLAYQGFCRQKKGLKETSIQRELERVHRFLRFAERNGGRGWEILSAKLLSKFLHALSPLSRTTRKTYMDSLRSFFRALFCLGILDKNWEGCVPEIAPSGDGAVSHLWSAEEIERLLGAIDRSRPIGKRDYAFCLLVARLGIRSGDATSLCLENFDWEGGAIRFVQGKTGVAHVLPLLADVGLAVIDYLLHGRPASPRREVFLRHCGSASKPLGCSAMASAFKAAQKRAGIMHPRGSRCGLHSLRHSLATRLLEEGATWTAIAGVLGHTNPDSTQSYAKSSMLLLRKVALDPEEAHHG